jgi:colicin import membrane protein
MAEKQAELDRQRLEQEEQAKAIRAEMDRLDSERREAEEAKRREAEAKERAEELAKARAEAAEKARQEAVREAEEKAKREAAAKAEAERQATMEAERKAAQAPDREKLDAYLSDIRGVPIPKIRDPKMQGILLDFTNAVVALDKALR